MIKRISPEEYSMLFSKPLHAFNTVSFNQLNSHKCNDVHYLVFYDNNNSKRRFGIILGERAGVLSAPFSAPFGNIEINDMQRISHYMDAVAELKNYGIASNNKIEITLPPPIYDNNTSVIASQLQAMLTNGGIVKHSEYNYHFDLVANPDPERCLWHNTKKNLTKARHYNWQFEILGNNPADIERCYEVIRLNRQSHGYPLRMSLDDLLKTSQIIDCIFMMLSFDNTPIASVVSYKVASGIVQIVYWGDVPGYSDMRPMNMLAYETFRYLSSIGTKIVDIGPSSSYGVPSLGLCDFKASLGCRLTSKFTIEL